MVEIHAEPGETMSRAITRAIREAEDRKTWVTLVFNGKRVRVYPESYCIDIAEKLQLVPYPREAW